MFAKIRLDHGILAIGDTMAPHHAA